MAVGAAIAVAGTAYSIFNNAQEANAKAKAESELQNQLDYQAGEIERRGSINRAIAQREGEQFIDRQSTAFSANGVDVSSSSGALDFLAYQHGQLSRQAELQRQQTVFEAEQTRRGILASQGRAYGYGEQANAKSFGNLLSLGGKMYDTYGGS